MAGFFKQKLLQELEKNSKDGNLRGEEISNFFRSFRLSRKDYHPLFKELENDGSIKLLNGRGNGIKIKILEKIKL